MNWLFVFIGLFILAVVTFFIMILTAPRTTTLRDEETQYPCFEVTTIKDSSGGVWVTTTEHVVHD